MRLSCPSCQTAYNVPDAALAGRSRTLRCASCGYQWQAGPLPAEHVPPPTTPQPPHAPEPAMAAELDYINRPRAAEPPASSVEPQRQLIPLPPGPAAQPQPDPISAAADARSQADRDTFAALLESSRKSGSYDSDPKYLRQQATRNPWLISILILLLAIALTWLERNHIMQAWPPSTRLFNAISAAFAHK